MAFPATPLPIKAEMLIDGTWTSLSSPNRVRAEQGITISRGRSNEQARVSAQSCEFTVDNDDMFFSNRNPMSANYGLMPTSTQVRVSVMNDTPSLLLLDYGDGSRVRTPDRAALDITGDIDVRIDVEPVRWRNGNRRTILCGKWLRTANQSWLLRADETGRLRYSWSTSGADGTVLTAGSNTAVSLPLTGRLAVRVVHDVDNGAGGTTVTFYTAPTLAGPWTAFGAPVVSAGTTSIFSGIADVEIGTANSGGGWGSVFATTDPFVGRVYGMEIRNSAGTLVADFDPTAQAEGATSWSDGLGSTWLTMERAEITAADRRFWGELSEAPTQWDGTGTDVTASIVASGLLRRLEQGNTPLRSPIYRNLISVTPTSYWPMEDASGSTTAGNAVEGGNAATIVDATFGSDESLPASAGVLTLGSTGPIVSGVTKATPTTTTANFLMYAKFPSAPLSDVTFASVYGNGTVYRWDLVMGATTYSLNGYDGDGTLLASFSTLHNVEPTSWVAFNIRLATSGGTITAYLYWHQVGDTTSYAASDTYTGTAGRFTRFITQGVSALADVKVAHYLISEADIEFITWDFINSSNGFLAESAVDRFERLCAEEGIQSFVVGQTSDCELMGYQPIDTLVNALTDCAAAEMGVLYEPRDALGLTLRLRSSLYNQTGLALDYEAFHLSGSISPTPDDLNIRNDVTATRPFGSFRRSERLTGPMSVLDPPNGVGRFDSEETVNVSADARLQSSAEQLTFVGTWDEDRYPKVQVDLHRAPFLADSDLSALVRHTDIGDYLSIDNMPTFATYDLVELMAHGMRETLAAQNWSFTFSTTPYGPFYATYVEDEQVYVGRAAETNSTLTSDITSGATSLSVTTPSPLPVWVTTATHSAEFPLDIVIGGEVMTVSAITSATSPQTFTVTRSVNGVVKAHSAGAQVIVRYPIRGAH